MKRFAVLAAGISLVAIVLATMIPSPVIAQTFKPVMSFIVNDTASPVPVKIVSAAATPSVVCSLDLGPSIGPQGSFYLATGSKAVAQVSCPDGISKVDVHRMAYTPDVGTLTLNVASYRLAVLINSSDPDAVVALLTDASPAGELLRNFRLDTTGGDTINWRAALTSGIADYAPKSGGTLYLIGTPVP